MFDGLYAMAMDDLRQCAVEDIRDAAFNAGQPLHVDPVYETGENWPYVWTRDTAYAALLSLAAVDPQRTVNSLLFKTARLKPAAAADRSAAELHIVQDTGTGESYPVSSDRVTWALGAGEALKYLHGEARERFAAVARAAITHTIEIDRTIVYDDQDGLYRGETSFLDWREQTYPVWVKSDLAHIAGSKALSTNVAHYACISLAASLERQQAAATKYEQWAKSLRQAIIATFYVDLGDGRGMWAATKGPLTHPSILRHYDLLGSALAVLVMDAGDDADEASRRRAEAVVATYPHAPRGPPVIHPQHPGVPIYHNSAIWPFVTALWVRAAVRVANWKVVDHGVWSLMRASALHLSNMENLEFLSGETFADAGPLSGPVVNSRRQLWSVAGYLAMVHDVAFGLQTRDDSATGGAGIRFEPFVTRWLRESLLGHSHEVVLDSFAYRGKQLRVRITLPGDQVASPAPPTTDAPVAVPGEASVLVREGADGSPELRATMTGAARPYRVARVTVNARVIAPSAWLGEADLLPPPHTNEWEIALEADGDDRLEARVVEMNLLGGEREAHYAPREPTISTTPTGPDGSVRLRVEKAADDDDRVLLFDVYRDGALYAERVGSDWTEDLPRDRAHSYSAQAVNPKSGLTSRHSRALWLPSSSRDDPHGVGDELVVEARDMRSNGGMLKIGASGAQASTTDNEEAAVTSYYCFWGDRHHWLTTDDVRPVRSGAYAVQVLYSNGAGTRSTGIACALKWLVVDRISGPDHHEGERTQERRRVVVMPQNSEYRWDDVWNWSTPVGVHLREGCRYAITLCSDDDDVEGTRLMNMSYLDHFTSYTNNGRMLGGGDGLANFVNIARIRLRSF